MSTQLKTEEEAPRPRRNRILKKGVASFGNQSFTRACSVHELSANGALLRFDDESFLPAEFFLYIEAEGKRVPCKWVRRVGTKAAVTFVGEFEEVAPPKKQVVVPSYDPTAVLKDREDELKQIIHNMRAGEPRETREKAKTYTSSWARNAVKSFGTNK